MSLSPDIAPGFNDLSVFDVKGASNNTLGYPPITLFFTIGAKHFRNLFIGVAEKYEVQTVFFPKSLVGFHAIGRNTDYRYTEFLKPVQVIPKIARFGGATGSIIFGVKIKNYLFIPKLVEAKFPFLTMFVDTLQTEVGNLIAYIHNSFGFHKGKITPIESPKFMENPTDGTTFIEEYPMVVKRGEVILAPMAGYTHSAFRRLARQLGADRTYTELISAPGIIHRGIPKKYAYFTPLERPIHIQLFGRNPDEISQAAVKVAQELKPDAIDINFGCSVPKVLKTGAAGKLLENPPVIKEIVKTTVEALKPYKIPVTAKIRLGLHEDNLEKIAEALIEGGVSAIALHPRLGTQGYAGRADWKRIADLKRISPVPVIGSGDIKHWRDIDRMFEETECDAVMVGRAALSNPWIFTEYRERRDIEISLKRRLETILLLLEWMFEYYPSREKACFEIRSLLVQLLKGFSQSREIKAYLMTVKGCEEFVNRLRELIERFTTESAKSSL